MEDLGELTIDPGQRINSHVSSHHTRESGDLAVWLGAQIRDVESHFVPEPRAAPIMQFTTRAV
jgi:hypothetical protein